VYSGKTFRDRAWSEIIAAGAVIVLILVGAVTLLTHVVAPQILWAHQFLKSSSR